MTSRLAGAPQPRSAKVVSIPPATLPASSASTAASVDPAQASLVRSRRLLPRRPRRPRYCTRRSSQSDRSTSSGEPALVIWDPVDGRTPEEVVQEVVEVLSTGPGQVPAEVLGCIETVRRDGPVVGQESLG